MESGKQRTTRFQTKSFIMKAYQTLRMNECCLLIRTLLDTSQREHDCCVLSSFGEDRNQWQQIPSCSVLIRTEVSTNILHFVPSGEDKSKKQIVDKFFPMLLKERLCSPQVLAVDRFCKQINWFYY